MKEAIATLESLAPYQQGRPHTVPKLEKETHDAYEQRTWIERGHWTEDGHMFIPPMMFKLSLCNVAPFLGMQIPGRGKSQYGKHFKAGVLVTDALVLKKWTKKNVQGVWVLGDSMGRSGGGGGSRVWKCFPTITDWSGPVTFYILDDTITEEVFEKHLEEAGALIGIGVFRPQNGGFQGRFKVNNVKWA